ncbi:GGDEF domain-containing protein [Microbacterium endophyticum]|uniref:GGDEF domain-containing protein n=1 Tax=Microbacterium endophyticum TaxID=1526412 RepID=A0A7W4V3I1_9MICO|nr:diguanylate cyclase [Microbacterium endophyticum]MBB2975468.1 GGDEF domain-containing protein [Microbacterium endophyticum]NIK35513.1 GGDEF domain-containing protein [Microbacterium endophyticum]
MISLGSDGGIGSAQLVVVSLCTVLIVGLGFIPRPSRATLAWALAFFVALSSAYLTVGAQAAGAETLRRIGLALLLGPPILIWSGLRSWRGARAYMWAVIPVAVVFAFTFSLPLGVDEYALAFRLSFAVVAVFCGFTIVETRRIPERRERMLLPLTVASITFIGFAISGLVSGLFPSSSSDPLALARSVNGLGILGYMICVVVSLLWLAQGTSAGQVREVSGWARFRATASERLVRARDRQEHAWALLMLRVDDIADIRDAAGEIGFSRIAARFESLVREMFPADADIGRRSAGTVVVLLPRTVPVTREHVRKLLAELSIPPTDGSLQVSASVGWTSVETAGYDFGDLERAARAGLDIAAGEGGDRWHRDRI